MTADLLASGATWLRGVFRKHASQLVTYHRGTAAVQLRATVGATTIEDMTSDVTVTTRVRDWIINDRNDLIIGGVPVEPAEGDTIRWLRNQTLYTFEVMPVGNNAWELADAYGNGYRVHTRLVTEE